KRYTFSAPFFYVNAAYGIDNQSVVNTPLKVFQCPSAPARDVYAYTFNYPGYPPVSWQAAPADYGPISSVSQSLTGYLGLTYSADQRSGALRPDRKTPLSMFPDGMSTTILLAEFAGRNQLWQAGKNTGQTLSGFYGGQGGWGDATSGASALYGS